MSSVITWMGECLWTDRWRLIALRWVDCVPMKDFSILTFNSLILALSSKLTFSPCVVLVVAVCYLGHPKNSLIDWLIDCIQWHWHEVTIFDGGDLEAVHSTLLYWFRVTLYYSHYIQYEFFFIIYQQAVVRSTTNPAPVLASRQRAVSWN